MRLSIRNEADKEDADTGEPIAVRLAILLVPIFLSARLLAWKLPRPLAWAASMFAWMLVVYWFPSRAEISLRRWLIIVSVSAVVALLLATFQPDLF